MGKYKSIQDKTRRGFLKTVANAGMSAGLLRTSSLATGMMLSRNAIAQNSSGISRVVCVYIPDGAPTENGRSLFIPSSNLTLPPASAALERVKDECVFFNGADVNGGGGHGRTHKVLGGAASSSTYDVHLERTIGANSPFPSLLLGVQSAGHGSATIKDRAVVSYQDNPVAAFNRLFGGNVVMGSADGRRAQSVLDLQKAEIQALQSVLGSAEKERLDEHLSSLERIEARINQQASQDGVDGCETPVWNGGSYAYDEADKTRFTLESDLQMDLAILAMKCNYTKVVSLMLGNHQAEHAVSELDWTGEYHQSIHAGNAQTFSETRNYLSRRLAYLIDGLRTTRDEFGNSMLDSTLVVQVTDMGDGNAHTGTNAPMLMAGGGSAIRRGRVVTCGDHVNIFDTVTEALGMTGQLDQLGDGPISGVLA